MSKQELLAHDTESVRPGEGSVVKICTCKHEFQDKRYGKGKRLFNVCGTITQKTYRCTVCGKTK